MLAVVDTVTGLLLDHLDFYLDNHLFPRLARLQDEEYFWEPVPGCCTVVEGPRGWEMKREFAKEPMAASVLRVSRETMHHGGETGVLRDLSREIGVRST